MSRRILVDGVDFTETMSRTQVADLFGVDVKTVSNWATTGRLTAWRQTDGRILFSRAQVIAQAGATGTGADGRESR